MRALAKPIGVARDVTGTRARRRVCLLLTSSAALTLLLSSGAQASTVTVGSPLTASFTNPVGGAAATFMNSALAEPGANVTSPISGVIVRWRMAGAYSGGPFNLRVLRPAGGGMYAGAGTSGGMTPTGTGTQTFTTNLPIQVGDLIGIDQPNSSAIGYATVTGSSWDSWNPPLADGSTSGPNGNTANVELGFNADVQPLPGIASINPPAGPRVGGTKVTIVGHDFTTATAVSFGAIPAASFTVSSDSQITATSPPEPAGTVHITVKNPGPSPAVAADRFIFTPVCIVPKLKGKKLKRARKALKRVDCKLGKVKGPKGKRAKVKKQKPKPGRVLPPGSKVKVTTK